MHGLFLSAVFPGFLLQSSRVNSLKYVKKSKFFEKNYF